MSDLVVASITTFVEHHSQLALLVMFGLVFLESFGLPVPGETALVACGVLASQGSLLIEAVIATAAIAAIIGDNLGYWAARSGGRPLLQRYRVTRRYADRYLPRGKRFFEQHGGKAVFFGRFVAVIRVTTAWTAGLSHMHWKPFVAWNAAASVAWATLVGLIAYFLGDAAARALSRYGIAAAGGLILITAAGLLVVRLIERRTALPADRSTEPEAPRQSNNKR